MAVEGQDQRELLREKGILREQPFQSSVPFLGPLIVGFRSLWNSVAAKWYVRPLIQQQSEFNTLLLQEIKEFEDQVYNQVIEQDRDQTHLIHETGELVVNLKHLNHMLQELEGRLASLEELSEANVNE